MCRRASVVAAPVHLLFISTAKEAGATSHPRNLIIAEKGSQVTVLESYVSTVEAAVFHERGDRNGSRAKARWWSTCKFQDESRERVSHGGDSRPFGAGQQLRFALDCARGRGCRATTSAPNWPGEGLECILNGLYLTRGDQLADHHMVVEHAQPHCASHEYFNGILDDKSEGRVPRAHPGAQAARRRPTPSRRTRTCCSPTTRRRTPSRNWRFTPTT